MARVNRDLLLDGAVPRPLRRRHEHERSGAVEDDEDLLLDGVAVWWSAFLARWQGDVAEARPLRAGACAEIEVRAAVLPFQLVAVHDVRGTRAWLGHVELACFSFEVPRMAILGDLHRRVHAQDARTGEERGGRVRPLTEGEHVEPIRPCNQRVGLLGYLVDDGVARTHLVRLAVLPRETGACEHVEDLLLVELDVDGRGASARVDL